MIDSERVNEIFLDSLFKDGEDTTNRREVEGILNKFGFHPERLESHRTEIEEMLMQLPDEFKQSIGGGWSFLQACMDRDGNQWTGLHRRMDQLFSLGIALGKVKNQLPRELWEALPGGMPYFVVLDK